MWKNIAIGTMVALGATALGVAKAKKEAEDERCEKQRIAARVNSAIESYRDLLHLHKLSSLPQPPFYLYLEDANPDYVEEALRNWYFKRTGVSVLHNAYIAVYDLLKQEVAEWYAQQCA